MEHGPHLRLTPWAREALTPDELAGLHARAAALDAYVFAVRSQGSWTVHVTNPAGLRAARYHHRGSLAGAMWAVLDEFAVQRAAAHLELEALLA